MGKIKLSFLLVILLGVVLLYSSAVFANVNSESVSCLDLPAGYRYVKTLQDGTILAESLEQIQENIMSDPNCPHSSLVDDGLPYNETISYNARYADKCYKIRTNRRLRCTRCGWKTTNLGYWRDVGHSFDWLGLGNKCKICAYVR